MLSQSGSLTLEEKIKQHKRLTYDILDGMVDWVRVIDQDGIIIFTNKSMQNATQVSLVGNKCHLIFGKSCPCIRCIVDATRITGEAVEKEERIGDKIFSVKSSPVRDLNGNIYAVVEVFRDVTRERTLEREIISKNEKMSRDINFAKKIQEKILPERGKMRSLGIDYMYKPSEMLSGDIFDIQIIDENHVGVYISDVVGHGVTASIMTMFIRQTMENIMSETLSPSETISRLHKSFFDLNLDDENYFTIFYGVINTKENTIKYSNGGHNGIPIIIRKNENEEKEIIFLEATGYPITYLFEEVSYEEYTVKLNKDDNILLFTDGILECRNENGELFGIDRLTEIAKKHSNGLLKAIEDEITNYSYKDLEDDLAILKIEVLE